MQPLVRAHAAGVEAGSEVTAILRVSFTDRRSRMGKTGFPGPDPLADPLLDLTSLINTDKYSQS